MFLFFRDDFGTLFQIIHIQVSDFQTFRFSAFKLFVLQTFTFGRKSMRLYKCRLSIFLRRFTQPLSNFSSSGYRLSNVSTVSETDFQTNRLLNVSTQTQKYQNCPRRTNTRSRSPPSVNFLTIFKKNLQPKRKKSNRNGGRSFPCDLSGAIRPLCYSLRLARFRLRLFIVV